MTTQANESAAVNAFINLFDGPEWEVTEFEGGWLLVADGATMWWIEECDLDADAIKECAEQSAAGNIDAYSELCSVMVGSHDEDVPVAVVEQARNQLGLDEGPVAKGW
jgi:hypothetical protein